MKNKKFKYKPGTDFHVWCYRVICGNRYGLKSELIDAIGLEKYRQFLICGMIYEPPRCPDEFKLKSHCPDYMLREWIATDEAYRRKNMLMKVWSGSGYYKLPATIHRSIWYQLKNKIKKYLHF